MQIRLFIYKVHIWVGLIVAIPVLAWASSGLLYAWPNAVEGGKIESIDATRVGALPSEALAKASEFAGTEIAHDGVDAADARRAPRLSSHWRPGR